MRQQIRDYMPTKLHNLRTHSPFVRTENKDVWLYRRIEGSDEYTPGAVAKLVALRVAQELRMAADLLEGLAEEKEGGIGCVKADLLKSGVPELLAIAEDDVAFDNLNTNNEVYNHISVVCGSAQKVVDRMFVVDPSKNPR